VAKHFIVKGRVQGVWYRQSTVQQAKLLNLTGWVKNLENGDVELFACGQADKLVHLENWLWQGPTAAKVSEVLSKVCNDEKFTDFNVIY